MTPTLPPIPFPGTWRWLVTPIDGTYGRICVQESVIKNRWVRKPILVWVTREWTVYTKTDDTFTVHRSAASVLERLELPVSITPGVYTRNGHKV